MVSFRVKVIFCHFSKYLAPGRWNSATLALQEKYSVSDGVCLIYAEMDAKTVLTLRDAEAVSQLIDRCISKSRLPHSCFILFYFIAAERTLQ